MHLRLTFNHIMYHVTIDLFLSPAIDILLVYAKVVYASKADSVFCFGQQLLWSAVCCRLYNTNSQYCTSRRLTGSTGLARVQAFLETTM